MKRETSNVNRLRTSFDSQRAPPTSYIRIIVIVIYGFKNGMWKRVVAK